MKLRIKNGRAMIRAEKTADDVVKRIEGILRQVKGVVYRVKAERLKRKLSIYVKLALKTQGFDSTWYVGSWSTPDAKEFSRTNKMYDHLPDAIRSTLFNLFTILPNVIKGLPVYAIRIEVWDNAGKPVHVSIVNKNYQVSGTALRRGYEETPPDVSQHNPYHGYGENPTMDSPELMAPPPGMYEDQQHGSMTLVKKLGKLVLVVDADQHYIVIHPKDKDWWDGPQKDLGAIGREKALRAFDKFRSPR